jgi:hypothetical protein
MMIIALVFGLAFPALFYVGNLTTEVRADGIYYRFFPFHLRFHRIAAESLVSYEVRTYKPIKDYGGWGIRYGRGSKAYNVSGNRGVMLEFSDGKRLLIGSQKPDDLANAISMAFGKKPAQK